MQFGGLNDDYSYFDDLGYGVVQPAPRTKGPKFVNGKRLLLNDEIT